MNKTSEFCASFDSLIYCKLMLEKHRLSSIAQCFIQLQQKHLFSHNPLDGSEILTHFSANRPDHSYPNYILYACYVMFYLLVLVSCDGYKGSFRKGKTQVPTIHVGVTGVWRLDYMKTGLVFVHGVKNHLMNIERNVVIMQVHS